MLFGISVTAESAKPTLAELFNEAEFVGQLSYDHRTADKMIFDESQGLVGFATNFRIFYSQRPQNLNELLGSDHFYLWTPQPLITDPPGPDSEFVYSLNPNTNNEFILFLHGEEEFSKPVRVESRKTFSEVGYPQVEQEEPVKIIREAYVPVLFGYGGFPSKTAEEWAVPESRILTIRRFESRFQRNAEIRIKLYGTSDISALRDAFAEVFANYPKMPSEELMEEKGEDFKVAAKRIHEALVEAFGEDGLRRLESGVLVPVEDDDEEDE